jgi:predicted hotdog family 3-hydroxylacyl-ACP dehydratase
MPAYPPIEELLPHRGAMRLVDSVFSANEDSIVVEATVAGAAWYLDEHGAMPAWIGIELMAQAIAAHAGLSGRRRGLPPKRGVLLGTRAFRSRAASVPSGTQLRIEARVALADESGFGSFDCTITDSAARELARATLKVYEPEDFEAFMNEQAR